MIYAICNVVLGIPQPKILHSGFGLYCVSIPQARLVSNCSMNQQFNPQNLYRIVEQFFYLDIELHVHRGDKTIYRPHQCLVVVVLTMIGAQSTTLHAA